MKHLKAFEHFNPHPESEPDPLEQTMPEPKEQKKVKTKEEVQKEDEEAAERLALGFISTPQRSIS